MDDLEKQVRGAAARVAPQWDDERGRRVGKSLVRRQVRPDAEQACIDVVPILRLEARHRGGGPGACLARRGRARSHGQARDSACSKEFAPVHSSHARSFGATRAVYNAERLSPNADGI